MQNRRFKKYEEKEIKRRWAKAQKRKVKDANAYRRLQVLYLLDLSSKKSAKIII